MNRPLQPLHKYCLAIHIPTSQFGNQKQDVDGLERFILWFHVIDPKLLADGCPLGCSRKG